MFDLIIYRHLGCCTSSISLKVMLKDIDICKNIKKLIDFYESIIAACEQIATEAKTLKKPRAKKVKPAEELVKKIKFKVSDDKLGISSVPPATLVGAQMAVVYNTRLVNLVSILQKHQVD